MTYNDDIINGMDKIMKFINHQYNTIKKQKKENEALEEKIQYLSEYQDDHPAMRHKVVLDADYYQECCGNYNDIEEMSEKIEECCGNYNDIEEMSEKIEELKKENEALKAKVSNTVKDAEKMNMDGWKIIAENEKLKKENDELKEKITCLESDSHNEVSQAEFDDAIDERDEEIKKLNYKIKEYEYESVESGTKELKLYGQLFTLQSQNEKLKDEKYVVDHRLFKFIIGGGEASDVEEIIREKMSKEFIDGNQEHWDQLGLFEAAVGNASNYSVLLR